MTGILQNVGKIFTFAIDCVGDVADVFTSATDGTLDNPILMFFVALPLCGLGIGFFKRLINVN